jgi:predicted small integral membrane protein
MAAPSFELAQAGYLAFLALWLLIPAYNNIVDRGTNRTLLHAMLTQKPLREPPELGLGLRGRIIDSPAFVAALLWVIVVVEFVIIAMLALASWNIAVTGLNPATLSAANYALMAYGALWTFFMLGGLWFGYWIRTWHLQQVHLTLMVFTVLGLILLNMPVRTF